MNVLIVTQADRALLSLLGPPAYLRRELQRAIVISSEAVPPDVVTMNSEVVYSDETADVRRTVRIVYPQDADAAEGRISVLSPVGAALLGLSAGQSIEWDFPDGSRRTLRVNEVVHQPERKLHPAQPVEPARVESTMSKYYERIELRADLPGGRTAERRTAVIAGAILLALPGAELLHRGLPSWMSIVAGLVGIAVLALAVEDFLRRRELERALAEDA